MSEEDGARFWARFEQGAEAESKKFEAKIQSFVWCVKWFRAESVRLEADGKALGSESMKIEADIMKLEAESKRLEAENERLKAESSKLKMESLKLEDEGKAFQAGVAKLETDMEKALEKAT